MWPQILRISWRVILYLSSVLPDAGEKIYGFASLICQKSNLIIDFRFGDILMLPQILTRISWRVILYLCSVLPNAGEKMYGFASLICQKQSLVVDKFWCCIYFNWTLKKSMIRFEFSFAHRRRKFLMICMSKKQSHYRFQFWKYFGDASDIEDLMENI